ncbi:MAG TPA: SMP-30/gluconolactonase/LRE family protein [Ferruginibacter sp.]|nr:SMP-30/gluconolactonase/LRE family protein [Ferruginibacter sp.]HPH89365.1 SMP-30/gluconolactonase/LRE family protein [Ferruginibacter sp.]
MSYRKLFTAILIATAAMSCNNNSVVKKPVYKTAGNIEKTDALLDAVISSSAKAEIIAEGFEWSEGPIWIEKQKMLLFSDVPTNTIYKWTEEKGKEIYLTPSGYTDTVKRGGEMGSNGLTTDNDGNLVLCQHGNRQMGRMDAPLDKPAAVFTSIAATYNGKKFSSPNDAVYNSNGELFFTDPPYGLETHGDDDPKKEISFNGVYKVKKDGKVVLLLDSITRPNGLAFFPGEKKLIIANSDPAKPYWYLYDVGENDSLQNGRIFFDASAAMGKGVHGLPDGLKIDTKGNVFATGPGGVWIFNSEAKLLGKIKLDGPASNCALSPNEKTLYITNDMKLLRVKLRD